MKRKAKKVVEDSAKFAADIQALREETKGYPLEYVVDHYIAAMMNLDAVLDQRDALQKKYDRLKSKRKSVVKK